MSLIKGITCHGSYFEAKCTKNDSISLIKAWYGVRPATFCGFNYSNFCGISVKKQLQHICRYSCTVNVTREEILGQAPHSQSECLLYQKPVLESTYVCVPVSGINMQLLMSASAAAAFVLIALLLIRTTVVNIWKHKKRAISANEKVMQLPTVPDLDDETTADSNLPEETGSTACRQTGQSDFWYDYIDLKEPMVMSTVDPREAHSTAFFREAHDIVRTTSDRSSAYMGVVIEIQSTEDYTANVNDTGATSNGYLEPQVTCFCGPGHQNEHGGYDCGD